MEQVMLSPRSADAARHLLTMAENKGGGGGDRPKRKRGEEEEETSSSSEDEGEREGGGGSGRKGRRGTPTFNVELRYLIYKTSTFTLWF